MKPSAATGGDSSSKATLSDIVSAVYFQIEGDLRKEFNAFRTDLRNELKQDACSKKEEFLKSIAKIKKDIQTFKTKLRQPIKEVSQVELNSRDSKLEASIIKHAGEAKY